MEHGHRKLFESYREALAAAKELAATGGHSVRVKRHGDEWRLVVEKEYPIGNKLLWESPDNEEIDESPF